MQVSGICSNYLLQATILQYFRALEIFLVQIELYSQHPYISCNVNTRVLQEMPYY